MLDLLLELLIQVIVEGLLEVSSQALSKKSWVPKIINQFLAAIIYLGLGAISGVVFTVFFPHRLVRPNRFAGLSLIAIPVMAALAMVGLGQLRRWQGRSLVRLDTFAYAFVFAFGMAAARLAFVE
jgi:hypothetical protein